ncbi:hypothetical protein SVAN01_02137 [Stagonosporopsis vannaccii]|nr:hypothetical protein SVAN01_02137 [Stagonosporopsis vannaccii]
MAVQSRLTPPGWSSSSSMFSYRACLSAACFGTAHAFNDVVPLTGLPWNCFYIGWHKSEESETLATPPRVEAAKDMFGIPMGHIYLANRLFVSLLVCESAAAVHEAAVLRLAGRRVCSLLLAALIGGVVWAWQTPGCDFRASTRSLSRSQSRMALPVKSQRVRPPTAVGVDYHTQALLSNAPPQWLNNEPQRPSHPFVTLGPICASAHRKYLLIASWAATALSPHAQCPNLLHPVISSASLNGAERGCACELATRQQTTLQRPPSPALPVAGERMPARDVGTVTIDLWGSAP